MVLKAVNKILAGGTLSLEEAADTMNAIMSGEVGPVPIAALLVALKQRGEKAEEVAGFVKSMRAHAVPVAIRDKDAVDGCGTGGDGAQTFNISTAAALVAAAAGVTVAKHGNRSVSSQCGSADVLEACGAQIDPGPETVKDNINEVGFGFMFAPRFHPAMKHAVEPRRQLRMRTVFNILGPMSNPAGVTRQLVGVYSREVMPLVAEVLAMSGSKHVLVVHSQDGLDEISIHAPTDYIELKEGSRNEGSWDAACLGLQGYGGEPLSGGDVKANLKTMYDVLDGNAGQDADAVAVNAGAMIYVSGKVTSLAEGIVSARDVLKSGEGRAMLDQWISATKAE